MLPAKEAKQISYRLVGENFLQLKELKLGTSTEIGKSSMNYYFFINLNQVCSNQKQIVFTLKRNCFFIIGPTNIFF